MTVTQALLGFAAVAAVLTLVPGLDTTLVLRSALVSGRRVAVSTALGVAAGLLAWGAAAAVGAAALLAASRTAYLVVTLAGAAYMAYLGVMLIVRSFRGAGHGAETPAAQPVSARRAFATGAWTNVLNPKIGVFYIATIPQFIPPGAPALGMGVLLAVVHVLLTLVWFALIILGAAAARRWLANARALRIVDRVAGTIMIGFGAKLVFAQR